MKPVTFDGWIFCTMGGLAALQIMLGGDEAAKHVNEALLFWVKGFVNVSQAFLIALKAYRSMSFAQYKLNGGADPSHTEVKVAEKPTPLTPGAQTPLQTVTTTTIETKV
jgi:hypothetical protein